MHESPSGVLLSGVSYFPSLPFKHNAARCHRIPRARYRVTNWAAYEAGLRRRGDITVWIDETVLAGWQAPRRVGNHVTRTWQSGWCSACGSVPPRPAAGGRVRPRCTCAARLDLAVPDHTTLSRRGQAFAGRQPRVQAGAGPVHLVLDSTGPELFGQARAAAPALAQAAPWTLLHGPVQWRSGLAQRRTVVLSLFPGYPPYPPS